jgi:DNA primase
MSKRITQQCIDAVFDSVSIDTWARLTNQQPKKKGANWFIKSPFNDEKTASCSIFAGATRYKDFSSQKGGTAVGLLMEWKGMTYPEAIEYLAEITGVTVEYEAQRPEDIAKAEQRMEMGELVDKSMKLYAQRLSKLVEDHRAVQELKEVRGLDDATIEAWGLGYAPDDGRMLTDILLEQGALMPALEVGLVRDNDAGRQYDAMRDAITFPIYDRAGHAVGFACRNFNEKAPKYVNAKGSKLYDKSAVLYGLNFAKDAIRRMNRVYIVEGNFDVINMHRAGAECTVATCGTALTPQHCDMLKRLTRNAVILRDGDKAGRKAARRDFELLMQHGFNVEVCHLPGGMDPDDFVRDVMPKGVNHREVAEPMKV